MDRLKTWRSIGELLFRAMLSVLVCVMANKYRQTVIIGQVCTWCFPCYFLCRSRHAVLFSSFFFRQLAEVASVDGSLAKVRLFPHSVAAPSKVLLLFSCERHCRLFMLCLLVIMCHFFITCSPDLSGTSPVLLPGITLLFAFILSVCFCCRRKVAFVFFFCCLLLLLLLSDAVWWEISWNKKGPA